MMTSPQNKAISSLSNYVKGKKERILEMEYRVQIYFKF